MSRPTAWASRPPSAADSRGAALRSGVSFERYDEPRTDERGIMDAGSFKSAWFRDPDGNTFALAGP